MLLIGIWLEKKFNLRDFGDQSETVYTGRFPGDAGLSKAFLKAFVWHNDSKKLFLEMQKKVKNIPFLKDNMKFPRHFGETTL